MSQKEKEITSTLSNKKIIIIIVLIFILGFAIRGHLLKYDYIFEFDTYWHLRATGYVVQGSLPDNDPLGYYHQGGTNYNKWPHFLWYLTGIIYFITTFGAAYDKWLLLTYAKVLPAIFGSLIAVAMYYLGKMMYNKKVGVVMGICAATIPAFVYRSMAGHFENDSLGFLFLVVGFVFLTIALKEEITSKKRYGYAILSGLAFGLMSVTWPAFRVIPLILIPFFVTAIIYMAIKKYSNTSIAKFVKVAVISTIIFLAIAFWYNGTSWTKETTSYVTKYLPLSSENVDRLQSGGDKSSVLSVTVGEEQPGKRYFLSKYNFLSFIPFLLLLFIPLYLIFSKKRDVYSILIFYWLGVTTAMAWTKLKFTFYLGLPIAAGLGFLFYFFYEYITNKSLTINLKRTFAVIFAFLLLISISAGIYEVTIRVPPIENQPGWQDSMFWVYENTSEDAKIFNWWDYGHWITYFTERKASTDNTNSYMQANQDFTRFVLSEDLNEALDIITEYDADYIMIDSTVIGKHNSFALYKYQITDFSDIRITRYFGTNLPCRTTKTPITNVVSYVCGNNNFSKEDIQELDTLWTNKPHDLIENTPVYIYRATNNSEIYILNTAVNNSMITRIWFNDSTIEPYFTTVYTSHNVKVIKVNKENIKNR